MGRQWLFILIGCAGQCSDQRFFTLTARARARVCVCVCVCVCVWEREKEIQSRCNVSIYYPLVGRRFDRGVFV